MKDCPRLYIGTLELAEMLELVRDINESATPEQAAALFRRADTDGSGAVDFDEFLAAVARPVTADVHRYRVCTRSSRALP